MTIPELDLEAIKARVEKGEVRPQDVTSLFDYVSQLTKQLKFLEKKVEVLNQQNMELTEQMENFRSDFGSNR